MRLMPVSSNTGSEVAMQDFTALYFANRKFPSSDPTDIHYYNKITPKIYREIQIPQIRRISDIVIYLTDRRIINIECKLTDYSGVLRQAIDHLKWADYSYICFHANAYLPDFIIQELLNYGIGLLLYKHDPDVLLEVVQSTCNRKFDKTIRQSVLQTLKTKDCMITGVSENKSQIEIW